MGRAPPKLEVFAAAGSATGEDVGQALDVGTGDDFFAALMLLAQAVDQLGSQDVDLAVEDPPAVGHLLLLVRELLDEILKLLVGQRAKVREGVHHVVAVLSWVTEPQA